MTARAVGALLTVVALAGCTRTTDGVAAAEPEPLAGSHATDPTADAPEYKAQVCEQLHADRWIELPGAGPGEPQVRIAQPPGWEPVPEMAKDPVKLILRNEALGDGVTNPVLSVAAGDATDGTRSAEDLLNDTITGFRNGGGQNIKQVPAEICGFPALMVNYLLPQPDLDKPIFVTAVTVMVPLDASVWNVVAMTQSTSPDNPTYMQDAQVMLAGLRIYLPR